MNDELIRAIGELNLPESIKADLIRTYSNTNSGVPKEIETDKFVELSNQDGRRARIILWKDEKVTIMTTGKDGQSHIAETKEPSPDIFYIAQAHFTGLGFRIVKQEGEGEEIEMLEEG